MKRKSNIKIRKEYQVQVFFPSSFGFQWITAWWYDTLENLPCVSSLADAEDLLDRVYHNWLDRGEKIFLRIVSRTISDWRVDNEWLNRP